MRTITLQIDERVFEQLKKEGKMEKTFLVFGDGANGDGLAHVSRRGVTHWLDREIGVEKSRQPDVIEVIDAQEVGDYSYFGNGCVCRVKDDYID